MKILMEIQSKLFLLSLFGVSGGSIPPPCSMKNLKIFLYRWLLLKNRAIPAYIALKSVIYITTL